MAINYIDLINLLVTRIKKNRKISIANDIVNINLGSGLRTCEGWINIDGTIHALASNLHNAIKKICYRLSGVKGRYSLIQYCQILENNTFIHHNLAYGIPLTDESVDCIFSCHFLEHLPKEKACYVLQDAYRVLKKGGLIRIGVPDLEYFVEQYLQGNKESAVDHIFASGQTTYLDRHRYMYDFDILRSILAPIGFNNIVKLSYQKGDTPDIDKLDSYPNTSLFIEANK